MGVVHHDRAVPAPGQPAGVDPSAEQAQRGRQDSERGEHRDQDRGHAAVAHAPQERLREDQRLAMAAATVSPENSTVRPAVVMVRVIAFAAASGSSAGSSPSSSRNRLITNSE